MFGDSLMKLQNSTVLFLSQYKCWQPVMIWVTMHRFHSFKQHDASLLATDKQKKYHTQQTANNKQTPYCCLNRKWYKSELGRSESVNHTVGRQDTARVNHTMSAQQIDTDLPSPTTR